MSDSNRKMKKLINILTNHSCDVREHDKVIIEAIDMPDDVIENLLDDLSRKNAVPLLNIKSQALMNKMIKEAKPEAFDLMAEMELNQMKKAQCFIGLRAVNNIYEMADIPTDKKKIVLEHYIKPVHYEYRNNHLNWVYFRYPTPAMAQNAKMSTEYFTEYYFDTAVINYKKLIELMQPLSDIMSKTDKVRIKSIQLIFYN